MKRAFIFPGQGAQAVGMGADVAADFPVAAQIFETANDVLGFDLAKLCFEGPSEELNTTTISQPAIFTVSAAMLEVLRTELGPGEFVPNVTAGLSLGEYTALYAAGTLNFEDALRLVHKRGQAMQAAADASEGSMVSIIGLDEDKVCQACEQARQGELLEPVNFNCPGQIVVSGALGPCDRVGPIAMELGAMKAIRLEVAGAFHTEMMAPAADALREALNTSGIADPTAIPTIANIDATYYKTPESVIDGLTAQLTSPILWQKCMETLIADGVETFYEIGPGRVLTGLMRRINRKANVVNVSTTAAIQQVLGA